VRLRSLAADLARVVGDGDPEIGGLALDSRAVRPGDLFAALPGTRTDGLAFVADALGRGAVAVLGDRRLDALGLPVPAVVADDPRAALARVAARLFTPQPAVQVAVTGTNGKSSVASFTRQLWQALGHVAGSIGTLGVEAFDAVEPLALTTPDAATLHRLMAGLAGRGVTHVAFEASSHALDQRRVDGTGLRAAAFTNLTRDHYDYHGSPEAYLAAKARLFAAVLPERGTAVLNADVPEHEELAAICAGRGITVLDYGRGARRLRLVEQRPTADGQRITLAVDGRPHRIESPLVGDFQAWNLLAAIGLVLASGDASDATVAAAGEVRGARGRMQLVGRTRGGAAVFVDYAHTPDALARVLAALRPHTAARLAVVMGAGGDRDPGKRPLMGAACVTADRVYVTDDNPRSEDPAAIRRAVLAGCRGGVDAGDRRAAIRRAIRELGAGDVLVVAGKGHETGQTIAGRTLPFDDAAVVAEELAAVAGERAA
jgi:UDP-N-acetylmuramoyl-L-alanyl-D-glutamate--2,6-diaminopimelate ligase